MDHKYSSLVFWEFGYCFGIDPTESPTPPPTLVLLWDSVGPYTYPMTEFSKGKVPGSNGAARFWKIGKDPPEAVAAAPYIMYCIWIVHQGRLLPRGIQVQMHKHLHWRLEQTGVCPSNVRQSRWPDPAEELQAKEEKVPGGRGVSLLQRELLQEDITINIRI